MNTLLDTLLGEFYHRMENFSQGVQRTVNFPNIDHKIMVAIGMRRVGKTYFLLQTIHNLLKKVPISRILFLNFEDDRLLPLNQEKLSTLIDDFYTLYPQNHDQECYIFLDEIQNVVGWETVVRRYFDTKKVKIYLTGSSSKLLSKEIATSLRGRSKAIEIWPFSFAEYMTMKNISWDANRPYSKKKDDQMRGYLKDYLRFGGFPEVILNSQQDRNMILRDYVTTVIFRDIVERYGITNIAVIKYLIKTMLNNASCSQSIHKLYNDLTSQGIHVGKTTVHDYLHHIEDAYLAFRVPIYAQSLRVVESNPKKIYAIDTGLAHAYSTSASDNNGQAFENLVFLDLKRYGHEVYYYLTKEYDHNRKRREVDFLSRDTLGNWHLNQVCWDMDDQKTREREQKALEVAEKELKDQGIDIKGNIITPNSYFNCFLPSLELI
jgi:predicted AAA+ superfamily ATPase